MQDTVWLRTRCPDNLCKNKVPRSKKTGQMSGKEAVLLTAHHLAKTVLVHHSSLLSAFACKTGNLTFILYHHRVKDKVFSTVTNKIVNYDVSRQSTSQTFVVFFKEAFAE